MNTRLHCLGSGNASPFRDAVVVLVWMVGLQGLTAAQAQAGEVTKYEVIKGILAPEQVSAEEINKLDANQDGRLDVADVIYLLTHESSVPSAYPQGLRGYIWGISAIFDGENDLAAPVSYSFAIEIPEEKAGPAKVVALPGFNPTRNLTRQDLSGQGQVPGAGRLANSPFVMSHAIPLDTTFTITETQDRVTLRSGGVLVPSGPGNRINPVGMNLWRQWTIKIDKDTFLTAEYNHGSITERITGFGPQPKNITGTIHLVPFGRLGLDPILQEEAVKRLVHK